MEMASGFVCVGIGAAGKDGARVRACSRVRTRAAAGAEGVKLPPVYFVVGGPGSGKGTQCKRLVDEFSFRQVCAGDLLREKAKDADETGALVENCIRNGKIVPGHITMELLYAAIQRFSDCPGVLIDGFPREMNQAVQFEAAYARARAVLFFSCSNEVLKDRLTNRGLTSGRVDDEASVIEKRINTFHEMTMPVVDYYRRNERLQCFDAEQAPESVFDDLSGFFKAEEMRKAPRKREQESKKILSGSASQA
uniref:Uncharacterized protein n=1 Tax=Rhodosorus marinus TaxID=101924 RepID=A0A7S2ZYV9_9RHOD|mmetsp:Transcript_38090/g.151173  ORF Transcript_38090/g.151173 Transcript_38090/m.151173 type:complete len:251 (+) Transcript_38090:175-927(+)|eukprot:CAMPEP_0113969868 /NCGR_PEP_ID=MMETSP0011_2-20120614/10653_1 /TAXON_ID=101924 /ORGANISM="Rhodosorus marinus" /LENGTH=250 /DNA_ID=CAMNT_0000983767 /DNA_START=92 /DNA_END=844 /DNA_ORIENTATION=- /assembly_acc=CAM_ASM_000156